MTIKEFLEVFDYNTDIVLNVEGFEEDTECTVEQVFNNDLYSEHLDANVDDASIENDRLIISASYDEAESEEFTIELDNDDIDRIGELTDIIAETPEELEEALRMILYELS
ncbi:MAG: hypothetical protein IJR33_10430 [Clostridia bacterium]|nr:hypothetical protein [Clostridia bacterium]